MGLLGELTKTIFVLGSTAASTDRTSISNRSSLGTEDDTRPCHAGAEAVHSKGRITLDHGVAGIDENAKQEIDQLSAAGAEDDVGGVESDVTGEGIPDPALHRVRVEVERAGGDGPCHCGGRPVGVLVRIQPDDPVFGQASATREHLRRVHRRKPSRRRQMRTDQPPDGRSEHRLITPQAGRPGLLAR